MSVANPKKASSKEPLSVEGKRRRVIFMTDEKFRRFKIKILEAGYASVTEFYNEIADDVLEGQFKFPKGKG